MNAGGGNGLSRFYGYKETFGDNAHWVDIPNQLTFVHITDPYKEDHFVDSLEAGNSQVDQSDQRTETLLQSQDPYSSYDSQVATYGLEALSAAASGKNYSYPVPPSSSHGHYRSLSSSQNLIKNEQPHSSQDLSFILNQSPDPTSPPLDPRLHADVAITSPFGVGGPFRERKLSHGSAPSSDDDLSFLLRYFCEGPGHWMDLFDLGRFFEIDVPVKAKHCPLLLYSAVALAAKSLGRLDRSSKKLKEPGPSYSPAEWLHKARTYYDLAISLLRQALDNDTRPVSAHSERPLSSSSFGNELALQTQSLPHTDSDEMVGTTTILCVYEFLDASGAEWSRHLDGAKSLFDIAKDGVMAMPALPTAQHRTQSISHQPCTKSRTAIFWNIVRQDMLDAFLNATASRLDANEISMWRSAGLLIGETGFIQPSNDPAQHEPMQDDMISNALVWLVMKVVNYIATFHSQSHPDATYWNSLSAQLSAWHAGLPDKFHPISTQWPDNHPSSLQPGIPRKWFARPMCASSIQWYHFARIQLLIHRPGVTPSETKSLQQDLVLHAKEIISVALAQSDDGLRVHSVQPLYAAGRILDDGLEGQGLRRVVLELLRGIGSDTGWATDYRIGQLREAWGWAKQRLSSTA